MSPTSLRNLCITSDGSLAILEEDYFIKFLEDTPLLEKVLQRMLLAGGCSVAPLGRVFRERGPHDPTTSYEKPVIPMERSRGGRLKLIDQLCSLVSRLHAKEIIHGDVKLRHL